MAQIEVTMRPDDELDWAGNDRPPRRLLRRASGRSGASGRASGENPADGRRSPQRATSRKDRKLRVFRLGEGLPSIPEMHAELQDMTDVLMGREPPPIELQGGLLALMEYADACYARASEMTMLLQKMETEGRILKNSHHYRFRTGELRTFMEMAKRAADLGSRRITAAQLQFEMERTGRESKGYR